MAETIANVEQFFTLYASDETLRARVKNAEAMYPGSLEIRDAVVTDVLLPIAEDIGLPFTLKELRAYETRQKMSRSKDEPDKSDEVPEEQEYWLLEHGWEEDKDTFKYLNR